MRHEYSTADGPALAEEHDIVYRGLSPGKQATNPAAGAPAKATWTRRIVPDDVLLFRYSALTFNAHRIHYDRRYVTEVEGYPGLVVHGPLLATLLVDLLRRNGVGETLRTLRVPRPQAAVRYCGVRCFAAGPRTTAPVALWAQGPDGAPAMQATATLP